MWSKIHIFWFIDCSLPDQTFRAKGKERHLARLRTILVVDVEKRGTWIHYAGAPGHLYTC